MGNDPSARVSDQPSEDEYQAFILALSESARGRAFLAEHARRSRAEDSEMLLTSVQRLESLVRTYSEAPAETPYDDLRGMLEAIRGAQAELDVSALAAQLAKLSALIEGVQDRLDTMTAPQTALLPAETPPGIQESGLATPDFAADAADAFAQAMPRAPAMDVAIETAAEPGIAAAAAEELFEPAVVLDAPIDSPPEEPFAPLPEPSPADALAAAVQDEPLRTQAEPAEMSEAEDAATMPEVAWPNETATSDAHTSADQPAAGLAISALVETLIAPAEETEDAEPVKVLKAGSIPSPPPFAGEDFSSGARARVMPPPIDPLADIKALSDDERLALFT